MLVFSVEDRLNIGLGTVELVVASYIEGLDALGRILKHASSPGLPGGLPVLEGWLSHHGRVGRHVFGRGAAARLIDVGQGQSAHLPLDLVVRFLRVGGLVLMRNEI